MTHFYHRNTVGIQIRIVPPLQSPLLVVQGDLIDRPGPSDETTKIKNEAPFHSRCGTIKNPSLLKDHKRRAKTWMNFEVLHWIHNQPIYQQTVKYSICCIFCCRCFCCCCLLFVAVVVVVFAVFVVCLFVLQCPSWNVPL